MLKNSIFGLNTDWMGQNRIIKLWYSCIENTQTEASKLKRTVKTEHATRNI